ncbi:hypothetical protein GCM10028812_42670 [Ancylobacter sonchi]
MCVVRRIGGRKSHPDFHRVLMDDTDLEQIVRRRNGPGRRAIRQGGARSRHRPSAARRHSPG